MPWVEDDRGSWDGIEGSRPPPHVRVTARAVIVEAGRIAAIERVRDTDRYFTLPGGGVDPGETAEAAAVREAKEELGLDVEAESRLAVVVVEWPKRLALQTYVWCRVVGGELGSGTGEEFGEQRVSTHGSYRPVWLEASCLPETLRPAWLHDRLPSWRENAAPERPDRFCESYDDEPG